MDVNTVIAIATSFTGLVAATGLGLQVRNIRRDRPSARLEPIHSTNESPYADKCYRLVISNHCSDDIETVGMERPRGARFGNWVAERNGYGEHIETGEVKFDDRQVYYLARHFIAPNETVHRMAEVIYIPARWLPKRFWRPRLRYYRRQHLKRTTIHIH